MPKRRKSARLAAFLRTCGGHYFPLPMRLTYALLLTPALSTATSLTLNRAVIQADQAKLRVYYSQLRK